MRSSLRPEPLMQLLSPVPLSSLDAIVPFKSATEQVTSVQGEFLLSRHTIYSMARLMSRDKNSSWAKVKPFP